MGMHRRTVRHPVSMTHLIGVDPGRTGDPAAINIFRRGSGGYDLVHLEQFNLEDLVQHTGDVEVRLYPYLAARLVDIFERVGSVVLVVDSRGVGAAFVEFLAEPPYSLHPIGVGAIGNQAQGVTITGGFFNVPTRELVNTMVMLYQEKRIRVAEGLQLAGKYREQLANYWRRTTETGQESFSARLDSIHDDLVTAGANALWFSEHGKGE